MKRLLFVHDLYGMQGGAERALINQAAYLSKEFQVEILALQDTTLEQEVWDETFSKRHKSIETVGSVDLVFVHKCENVELLKSLKRRGLKLAFSIHDHEIYCPRGPKYFAYSQRVCKRRSGFACLFPCMRMPDQGKLNFYRSLDLYIVASSYMKEELIRQGFSRDKIHVIPPVLSEMQAPPSERRGGKIAYTGQLLRGKGLDYLIRALPMVEFRYHLDIFGEGPFRSTCEKLIFDLGLQKRVHFHGVVPESQLIEAYRSVGVGCVPSVWPEPFGMVGLEYMRQEIPVVAFDVGGISDWLKHGENGLCLPPRSSYAFSEGLRCFLGDPPLRKRMGKRGREIFLEKFHPEQIYGLLLLLLKKMC